MQTQSAPEVWLRGPLPGVPPLLQPAAHALLQALEEINGFAAQINNSLIWEQPYNSASVAFHLQHITGFLDRLLTYARGEQLTVQQLEYLAAEGQESGEVNLPALLAGVDRAIHAAITQFSHTEESTLTHTRFVGRNRLPSTVIGLLFHAAEHTQRHTGQLLMTCRILGSTK